MSEAGSPSIAVPDYWWYRARSELLRVVMEPHVGDVARVLDVGSADGPSVGWLRGRGFRVPLDMDPRGLGPGGVQGSATRLPFGSESFDVVAAFDVVEHCEEEAVALSEMARVLVPGGRLLMSVPAYEWAWTHHDDLNQHHRRYTRRRARRAVRAAGLRVERSTYAFSATFPMFAADRLRTRWRERRREAPEIRPDVVAPLPEVGGATERVLMSAVGIDRRVLARRDLPFGSSILVVATKPMTQRKE